MCLSEAHDHNLTPLNRDEMQAEGLLVTRLATVLEVPDPQEVCLADPFGRGGAG